MWIKSCGIAQVAILTGSSNEERIDAQINSEPFRYLVSVDTCPKLAETLRYLSIDIRITFFKVSFSLFTCFFFA